MSTTSTNTQSPPAILAKLAKLRDHNRLALHVWEKTPRFAFPDFSFKTLSTVPADEIDAHLQILGMPLLSMTLLPASNGLTPCSVTPYAMTCGELGHGAYLVNMDFTQTHPPKVLRASPKNLNSYTDPYEKNLRLYHSVGIPALDFAHSLFIHSATNGYEEQIAKPEGLIFSRMQLDFLGQHMRLQKEKILDINEIVVAAAKEHIIAIAVPLYQTRTPNDALTAFTTLQGAVCGLCHLKHKTPVNLPVVMYHMNNDPVGTCGEFTYIGQSRQEFREKVRESLAALQACGLTDEKQLRRYFSVYPKQFLELRRGLKETVYVDICAKDWLGQLERNKRGRQI